MKAVKRSMAGEYSRELSIKVFAGRCRLIEHGFRQGGAAGYGLRQRPIDQSGASKGEFAPGKQKSIQTDRVVLIPGPPEEVATVRWMYRPRRDYHYIEINRSLRRLYLSEFQSVADLQSLMPATTAAE